MLTFLRSLKSRLLFLICIVTLPGLIAIVWQTMRERDRSIEVTRQSAFAVAQQISAKQRQIIAESKAFLTRLSQKPILLTPESPACSRFLTDLRNLTGRYATLAAPRANGDLLCSTTPLTERVNVASHSYIQKAIKSKGFSIGTLPRDHANQTTTINLAYPIINPKNSEVAGLTVAAISLEWWSKQLQHANLLENSVAYLTDAEDNIIALYPEDRALLGQNINKVQTLIASNDLQPTMMLDKRGQRRVVVQQNLLHNDIAHAIQLTIGAAFDKELALINTRLIHTLALFIVFIVSVAALAFWRFNRSILAPLTALNRSTQQLALGEHLDNQQRAGTSELIELQCNFHRMAKTRLEIEQQLLNSQAFLEKSKRVLLRHLQNTPLGSISWNTNLICTEWNRAAEGIFGYSAEQAIGTNITTLIAATEQRSLFIEQCTQLLQGQGSAHSESTHITATGRSITCHWYNTQILNSAGEITAIATLVQDITTDKRNQEVLDKFFELPMNIHFIGDFEGAIVRINACWQSILGYNATALLGESILSFLHPEDVETTMQEIKKLRQGHAIIHFENRLRTQQGEYRLISWSTTASVKEQSIYAVGIDITERKHAEDELTLAAAVFTYAKEAIVITDAQSNIIDVNETFVQLSGYSKEEVLGQKTSLLKSGRQSESFYREMWQSITDTGSWSGEIWNKRKNGEIYPQIITISSVTDNAGVVQHYIALFTDISEIKAQQKQLEHIAHYDLLTNLPNRTLLGDRLLQAMPQCKRNKQYLAVAFLDLDGFKAINDTYGHMAGDRLLVELSKRMQAALRDGDTLSRFGGDEFIAVLVGLERPQSCESVLTRLLKVVSAPVVLGDVSVNVSASIGVTIYPNDDVDEGQLLRHADQAMYVAKQKGKNRYHLFDMEEDIALKEQHDSVQRIHRALQQEEFVLYYQPKVDMRTGELVGTEALIRWLHPKRGLLAPIDFLAMIEGNKLIIDIGEWVIDTALKQIANWQESGLRITVSVNINALQLQQANFAERLASLLQRYPDVDPSALTLEVLETKELGDIDKVAAVMHACTQLGVSFALDDFGTGYCSLTYLKQLPVALIKIDQSFIRDMLTDPDDLAIVKGVIGLSKAFQRDIIAEGVETLAHGRALLQLGCTLAQGYGIARPMLAEAIPAWAATWQPDTTWSQIKE